MIDRPIRRGAKAHDRPPEPSHQPRVPPRNPDPPGPDVIPVPVHEPVRHEHPDPVREPPGDKPPAMAARAAASASGAVGPR